jgi:alkylation response protein AidB-like acyl-CoA dehydrogenase
LQLSVDKRAAHDAAPEFCARELTSKVLPTFRHETTDLGLFRTFGDMGLLDFTLPPTYGGAWIGSFGLSEPDCGSGLGGLQTRIQSLLGGSLSISKWSTPMKAHKMCTH